MGARESIVQWDDSYSLGLQHIDEQHKVLFDIMNHLWSAIVRRAESDEMDKIIGELEHYTISHFSEEEKFMEGVGFSNLDAHRRQHTEFVRRIRDARSDVRQGKQVSLELLQFLRDWLVKHIQAEDRSYANEYETKKQPTSALGRFFSRLLRH